MLIANIFSIVGHNTPSASLHGSDDEDSVDEEQELKELGLNEGHN